MLMLCCLCALLLTLFTAACTAEFNQTKCHTPWELLSDTVKKLFSLMKFHTPWLHTVSCVPQAMLHVFTQGNSRILSRQVDTPSFCYISGHSGGCIENEAGEYEWVIEFQYVEKVDHVWFVGINWYVICCTQKRQKRAMGLESPLLIKMHSPTCCSLILNSKTYPCLLLLFEYLSNIASVPCVLMTAAFIPDHKCMPQHSQNTFLHFSGLLLRRIYIVVCIYYYYYY